MNNEFFFAKMVIFILSRGCCAEVSLHTNYRSCLTLATHLNHSGCSDCLLTTLAGKEKLFASVSPSVCPSIRHSICFHNFFSTNQFFNVSFYMRVDHNPSRLGLKVRVVSHVTG